MKNILKIGNRYKPYHTKVQSRFESRKPGYLLILVNFHAPGFESAFPMGIRIQIQNRQIKADQCGSGFTTLVPTDRNFYQSYIYNNGPEEFHTSFNFLASYSCSHKGEVRQGGGPRYVAWGRVCPGEWQTADHAEGVRDKPCTHQQGCGSGAGGSVCFWASLIRIRIRSHKYGSGSGSGFFHHQAKIVRKPWFVLFCDFFMTFYQCSGSTTGSGSVPMFLGLPYSHPDPFDTGTNPRIRIRIWIRTKM